MNNRSYLLLSLAGVVFALAPAARAQSPSPSPAFTRPRVVNASQQPAAPAPTQTPAARIPAAQPTPYAVPSYPAPSSQTATPPQAAATPAPTPAVPLQPAHPPSVSKFKERAAEAQRLMKSRLQLTSATPNLAFVTVAALEEGSNRIHTLSVPKETFLTRGTDVVLTTAQGLNVRLQVVRPNYVNTAVVVSEAATGRQLTPLLVEYPLEKFGRFRE
ncbi:MAG TPA: hypothetical protein VF654_10855, partial [Pyrinomonadaceae bacterium]